MVNDFAARRCALDAIAAGVPKELVRKWLLDLSRNFFVTDDESFETGWWELRHRWDKAQKRNKLWRAGSSGDEQLPAKRRRAQEGGGSAVPRQGEARNEGSRASPRTARGAGAATRETPEESSQAASLRMAKTAKKAAVSAEEDVVAGLCASYEQALAVRLTLALSTNAAVALDKISPPTVGDQGLERATKRLLLLVHPDKTPHPLAKEAFQLLAPVLRQRGGSSAN